MSNEQVGNVQTVVTIPTKSVGISLILTFQFGSNAGWNLTKPLGNSYVGLGPKYSW